MLGCMLVLQVEVVGLRGIDLHVNKGVDVLVREVPRAVGIPEEGIPGEGIPEEGSPEEGIPEEGSSEEAEEGNLEVGIPEEGNLEEDSCERTAMMLGLRMMSRRTELRSCPDNRERGRAQLRYLPVVDTIAADKKEDIHS